MAAEDKLGGLTMPAPSVTGREGALGEVGEVQTLEAVSPWKAMVRGSAEPHREAAALDTPQGRARCFQVEGDTLDLRAVTGLISY